VKHKTWASLVQLISTALLISMVWFVSSSRAEKNYAKLANAQAEQMLEQIEADIKQHYYDPNMHGLDLDKRFDEARQKIIKAQSQDEALLDIAAAVTALKDSHTRFLPPARPYGVDYGWVMQAVGDSKCYITAVRAESDAAAKGMKAGDQVVSLNGVSVVREDISYLEYSYRVFPQSGFHVLLRSPDGAERPLVTMAKVIPGQFMIRRADFLTWAEIHRRDGHSDRSRYYEPNKQVVFWKLKDFVVDPVDVESSLNKVRSHETIVLDLRGNPGGRVDAADKLIGGFFDHDLKVADRKGRKELKPVIAKTRGRNAFTGKLIVLIDSKSVSAAEVFARVVQLEKRGVVLGDRSAGAVMESDRFVHAVPLDTANVTQYGAMITVADLIMSDGKSLENVGVTPDERILPTADDIAAGRDPVLARAAALAGLKMTPEEAGKVFPFEWPKERMPEID
jgi:C-terminal processing protease CtpA/Prc